jgi:flagellar secretion chaperone FliS
MALYSAARRSPADCYQDIDFASRVESATPHGLVTILYAELALALDVLERAQRTGDDGRSATQHQRAASILHALASGLDTSGGGELAHSLAGIYRQMQRRLAVARGGDVAATQDVRSGIASLAEAWRQIG